MTRQNLLRLGLSLVCVAAIAVTVSIQSGRVTAAARAESGIVTPDAPVKSLCTGTEQTIWTCSTAKNKIVSVCASKGLTSEKGYVQYRFGTTGNIELEVPKNKTQSQEVFKYTRYTRPLVTMLTLKFVNQGFTYELHDDDNEEEKPPSRTASVDITNASGKAISSVTCRGPVKGSLMKLEGIVPNDEN